MKNDAIWLLVFNLTDASKSFVNNNSEYITQNQIFTYFGGIKTQIDDH